jgi:hypothetical protein
VLIVINVVHILFATIRFFGNNIILRF